MVSKKHFCAKKFFFWLVPLAFGVGANIKGKHKGKVFEIFRNPPKWEISHFFFFFEPFPNTVDFTFIQSAVFEAVQRSQLSLGWRWDWCCLCVNVIDIPPPASLLLGPASPIIQLDCLLIITRNNANQGGQTGPAVTASSDWSPWPLIGKYKGCGMK